MFEYAHRVKFVKPSPEFMAERYEYEKRMVAKGIPITVKYFPELWEGFIRWDERPSSPPSSPSS